MTCATCRFAYQISKKMACRRYPPQTHFIVVLRNSIAAGGAVPTEEQRSAFPAVNPDWLCGEHAPAIALDS